MSKPATSVADRFWPKVTKTDGCWEWNAHRLPTGYGQIHLAGRAALAHRVSWTFAYGEIPDGLFVCHRCDNPSCVRPDHLFLGTAADNNRDMAAKARSTQGEKDAAAKLSAPEVRAIRGRYADGGITQFELAAAYGVCQQEISQIVRGNRWAHLGAV